MNSSLTADERHALEGAIGAGMVEFGGPWSDDDLIVRACHKLGLEPVGWNGELLLPEKP